MRKQILKIGQVYISDKLYPRTDFSKTKVNQYTKDMNFGDIFPRIHIAKFRNKFYLVDGLHRLKAKENLGEEFVECDVQDNLKSELDIFLASIRANLKHGHRLNKQDKEKIAKQLKGMKVNIDDISKLLHLGLDDLERIGLHEAQREKAKKDGFTHIWDSKKRKVGRPRDKDLVEEYVNEDYTNRVNEEVEVDIMPPKEEQNAQLGSFLAYINEESFEKSNNNNKLIKKIIKELEKVSKKMYP